MLCGLEACSRSKAFTSVMASFFKVCCYGLYAVVAALVVLQSVVAKQQTAQQVLVNNGLPRGLLPSTVRSYTLATNGKFQVNLWAPCTTKIGPEEVYYKNTITGVLTYKSIKNLDGIQVHEWFWFSVTSIEVDKIISSTIWFKIGYLSKSFSTDVFEVPPVCNSLAEEEEDKNALTFSEWLTKALDGTLEVNVPYGLDIGAARKMLQ